MKRFRNILCLVIAILVTANFVLPVLAATWDLEQQGSLYIDTDEDYTVTSTDGAGNAVTTSNTIYVAPDVNTTITMDNVHIASYDESGIYVGNGADVTLNLVGDNSIYIESEYNDAGIRFSEGDLTITSQTGGTLDVENNSYSYYNESAAIGSNAERDMSGNITIGGDATVYASSDNYGAGIGSGADGDMSGTITIQDNAKVEADSRDNGAGIGSGAVNPEWDEEGNIVYGEETEMSGSILITDNAQVIAESDDDGAGIGSGQDSRFTGDITISGNAQVWAESEDRGAGIGTGENMDLEGDITISGNAKVSAIGDDDSAGIGAGEEGGIAKSGTITITDTAEVLAIGNDKGAGIGGGENQSMEGTVTISGNANVTALAGDDAAAIGSDKRDDMTGTIRILDEAQVTTGVSIDAVQTRNGEFPPEVEYEVDDTLTGYIGGGCYHTPSTNGTYYISTTATINGVSGEDVEALAEYVHFAEDLSNLILVYPDEAEYRIIWNADKTISAIVSAESGVKALNETALKDAKLTEGVAQDKILDSCNLAYDAAYAGSATLRFHLGTDHACKTVEIRFFQDGQIVTKTVTVTASGIAAVSVNALGDFAVIAK